MTFLGFLGNFIIHAYFFQPLGRKVCRLQGLANFADIGAQYAYKKHPETSHVGGNSTPAGQWSIRVNVWHMC